MRVSDMRDDELAVTTLALMGYMLVKRRRRSKNRTKWRKDWLDLNHMPLVRHLQQNEPDDYHNYIRMDHPTFMKLLEMVEGRLAKEDTIMRQAIPAEERLLATLRFLACGRYYNCLRFSAGTAEQTLGYIIPETSKVIYEVLSQKYLQLPSSEEEWATVAHKFNQRWDFINCVGAIDGKHIRIRRPPHSSALYYNYKNYYSFILMAVVDAEYKFMWIDVGKQGRMSDGGIFEWTSLCHYLKNDMLHFPPATANERGLECVFVADEAFPLTLHMLKPYAQKDLNYERRIFNYRLSRARNVVENAFGILTSRFRIFHQPLSMNVDNAKYIVAAACVLHNFLVTENCSLYCNSTTFDRMNPTNWETQGGQWRNEEPVTLPGLHQTDNRRSSDVVKAHRDSYCTYFNTDGKVVWQDVMLQKGKA